MNEAGKELDALIAEKVMGWQMDLDYKGNDYWVDFKPSTNTADAWIVFEKFKYIEVEKLVNQFKCWIYPPDPLIKTFDGSGAESEWCETAPLAICLAALEAVGVIKGGDDR